MFKCNDHIEADEGSNTVMSCSFEATPDTTDAYWKFEEDGDDQELRDGERSSSGNIQANVNINVRRNSIHLITDFIRLENKSKERDTLFNSIHTASCLSVSNH